MRRVWLFFAMAACTAVPPVSAPEVERVILYRDTVNVLMSDGSLCAVDRPGRARQWSGVTGGCPHALEVQVFALPEDPRRELHRGGDLVTIAGQGWG
ncbi:MAG: hypothetical protein AAGM21_09090 [Pseudomonadota bacterium]